MTKKCPSCSPPDWATNVCETKSWTVQQGILIRWHWRLYAGEIHVLPKFLSGYGQNWYSADQFPEPVLCREMAHGYTTEQISLPTA